MRKALRFGLAALFLVLLAAGILTYFYAKTLGFRSRQRIMAALGERFNADVTLASIGVSFLPHPGVVVEGLAIRPKDSKQARPLIYIRRFSAKTTYLTLLNRANRVELVLMEGLQIHLPPRGERPDQGRLQHLGENTGPAKESIRLHFLIDRIVADGTLLEIEPKRPGKQPLCFELQKLTLHSVGPGRAMAFQAKLTNAKPPGLIDTNGFFGPWQRDDPRSTSVSGSYTFQNADLGVFNGIAGILSSAGNYSGVLERIEVNGTTDTPNFALRRGGEPVHLTTSFHSIVDGTDGDTVLDPVDAKFGASEFICRGAVVHLPGSNGKTISLDAEATDARMEDILELVAGGKPMLTGSVDFKSKILIPQGPQTVLHKLKLDGRFSIRSGRFTSPETQRKLRTLSLRARGISEKEETGGDYRQSSVASDLNGSFRLGNATASFSRLSFRIPGASIALHGSYNLRSEAIDMKGLFSMDATLSDTQSGLKSWMLKALDPWFKKNGAGFQVPIAITGDRKQPVFAASIFHHRVTIH